MASYRGRCRSIEMDILSTMKFDGYTLQARMVPAYIVLLPLAVGIQMWLPEVDLLQRIGSLLVAPLPLVVLIAQLGRDRGHTLQKNLWNSWGGTPTTQFLRHRNGNVNPITRLSYHKCIEKLFPELKMPTPEEEAVDNQCADRVYDAAAKKLIVVTRNQKRFSLIYKENISYGFRRNLWAMRPHGIICSLVGGMICIAGWWMNRGTTQSTNIDWLLAFCTCLLLFALWCLWINRMWVRIPANAYAERLLESCHQLQDGNDKVY